MKLLFTILLRIIFTIILVHYGTNLLDTVYCEDISSQVALPEKESKPTTKGAIILVILFIGACLLMVAPTLLSTTPMPVSAAQNDAYILDKAGFVNPNDVVD
jgi:TRAP-type C4-dicarboxylate transport system permease small subunit